MRPFLISQSRLCLESLAPVILRASMSAAAAIADAAPGPAADADHVVSDTTNADEAQTSLGDNAKFGQAKCKMSNLERRQLSSERKRKRKELELVERAKSLLLEATVTYKDGLRHVQPYYYTFLTHAKERWCDRSVEEVFSMEFRTKSLEILRGSIRAGDVTLNGVVATSDTLIRQGDAIQSKTHRHEPAVTAQPIRIIRDDGDLVAVDKPSSIPVHPTGPYRHNSMTMALQREHGMIGLRTLHRLDRLTSGVLMFGRTHEITLKMGNLFLERKLQKTYLARVVGEFPSEEVVVDEPMQVLTPKFAICGVHPDGKVSKTVFQRLHYDGFTSVVKCLPRHGRMHQIRVHLRHLGHPIINDPIYNHPAWKDPSIADADWSTRAVFVLHHFLRGMLGPVEGDKENEHVLRMMEDARLLKEMRFAASAAPEADQAPATTQLENSATTEQASASSSHVSDSPTNDPNDSTAAAEAIEPAAKRINKRNPAAIAFHLSQCRDSSTKSARIKASKKVVAHEMANTELLEVEVRPPSLADQLPLKQSPGQETWLAENCWKCLNPTPHPQPEALVMYLHALSYEAEDFKIESEVPEWAKEGFKLPEFLLDPDAMGTVLVEMEE